MSKGWLLEGLRDASREAEAHPELRERVATHPSGFLCELQSDGQNEIAMSSESSDCKSSVS
jgi:hypothetical protein